VTRTEVDLCTLPACTHERVESPCERLARALRMVSGNNDDYVQRPREALAGTLDTLVRTSRKRAKVDLRAGRVLMTDFRVYGWSRSLGLVGA
jgi:hypothetical protein